MPKKMLLFLCVFLFLLSTFVLAAIPRTICFQGKLLDKSTGAPVTATKSVKFTIYDGGTSVWTQTSSVTPDNRGIFNVILGPLPASLDFSNEYEVGVKVDTDAEMTPRQKLTTSPYAFRAITAESVVGGGGGGGGWMQTPGVVSLTNASDMVGIGTAEPTSKLTVAGTIETTSGGVMFPDGSILTSATVGGGGGGAAPACGWTSEAAGIVSLTTLTDNVGIGTAEPTAKLHIGGTPGVDGIRFPDGTLQTTAGGGGGGGGGAAPACGWTSEAAGVVSLTTLTDKVGIGTTEPGGKLDVAGVLYLSGGATSTIRFPEEKRLDIYTAGGLTTDTPSAFWRGVHISGPSVTESGVIKYPRLAIFQESSTLTDPSDLKYYISCSSGSPSLKGSLYLKTVYGGGDIILLPSGNVGIGITGPGQKLTVAGTIETTSGGIKFPDGSIQTYAAVGGGGAAPACGWTSEAAGVVSLATSTDNVGIGTSAATAKLTISDDTNAGFAFYEHNSIASSAGALLRCYRARGTAAAPEAILAGDNIASIRSFGYTGTGWAGSRAAINFTAAEGWTSTANGTYIGFSTTPIGAIGAVDRMRIADTGNVGIGTSEPTVKLLVNGGGGSDSMVKAQRNGTGYGARLWVQSANNGVLSLSDSTGNADGVSIVGAGKSYFNGGNVGIGTFEPTATLEVKGFVKITGGSPAAGKVLTSSDTSGFATWQTPAVGGSSGWIKGAGKVTLETITDNVGIGTPTPSHKLTVSDGSGAAIGMYNTSSANSAIRNYAIVTDKQVYGDFHIMQSDALGGNPVTAGTSRLVIGNNGNVGIGTTSPGYKLAVIGDIIASSDGTSGGWVRTYGDTGWYNQKYDGGWYMSDSGWLRSYNGKNVWTGTGLLGSNGGLTVGYGGVTPNTSGGAIIAGNVGIGTREALGKLQVITTDDTTPSSVTVWDARHFVVGQNANTGGVGISYNNTSGYGVIQALAPNSAWKNLVLQSGGGYVGIGTTTPTVKLTIDGPATEYSAIFARGAGLERFALNVNAGDGGWSLYDFSDTSWTRGITQKAGNVGIGTTGPTASLHASRSDGSYQFKLERTTAPARVYGLAIDATGGSFVIDDVTANTRRLTINTAGNVSVGGAVSVGGIRVTGGPSYTGSTQNIASGGSFTWTHSLGYIPFVTVVTTTEGNVNAYISSLTSTQVKVYQWNTGANTAYVKVHCW